MNIRLVGYVGAGSLILTLVAWAIVLPVFAQVEDIEEVQTENVEPAEITESVSAEVAETEEPAPVVETGESTSEPEPEVTEATLSAEESLPAPEEPVEQLEIAVAPEGLAEVQIIGKKYTDYFTDGTTEYSFPGDPEIHAHIAEKDAPIPTHEGMTWVHSVGTHLYDTESGNLEIGQYAVEPGGTIIANYPPLPSLGTSTSTSDIIAAPTTDTDVAE